MRWMWLVVMFGCGDGSPAKPDASVPRDAPRSDASSDASKQPTDTLFLQTEGVALVVGTADATMNKTALLPNNGTTAPWRAADANRATEIAELVTELETLLTPYNVRVVTTRPAAAPYEMIIITDTTPGSLGLSAGLGAVTENPVPCGSNSNSIGIAFPGTGAYSAMLRHVLSEQALAMFAFADGIPLSTSAGDCMCFASSSCNSFNYATACTIGGAGTMVDPNAPCGAGTTMDENMLFLAKFGTR